MRYGLCGFLIIKLQIELHHAMQCGTLLRAMQCGYAILQAVLLWFLRFMQFMRFDEHPYLQSLSIDGYI